MKKFFSLTTALFICLSSLLSQNTEWATPHVGYSSTDMLNVDKVK